MARFRPSHATVVAYVALAVALVGTAAAASAAVGSRAKGIPNAGGFYNSGLIKLDNGQSALVTQVGPFRVTAKCVDAGGGSSTATLTVKNVSTKPAVLESDYNGEYATPQLPPGTSRTAFYPESNSSAYFFGDYYNLFSAAGSGTAITGMGSVGWKTLGADCVFQLVLIGK